MFALSAPTCNRRERFRAGGLHDSDLQYDQTGNRICSAWGDRQQRGQGLMTESEHPPEGRIGALLNYTDRLASMRTHLSVVTVLVVINLLLTAVLLWRLWNL